MTGLRELLACPACRGPLAWSERECHCDACGAAFRVEDGIPILLPPAAADRTLSQAAFFDSHGDPEFETTRPHGAPELYAWLLREKFRRGIGGLERLLPGAVALTVCGGSGMDAEFLARAGARVISSDASLGAARRARERARRYGIEVLSVVADATRLPFADRAVDVAYVHDGLHHLEQPLLGVAEMARVAAKAVSVTEPAQAVATAVAVHLGLALERERAGNRVARIASGEIVAALETQGFHVLGAERYAMYYRHEPGRAVRRLSAFPLLPLARGAFRLANLVLGGIGNKLAVRAVRPGAA